MVRAVQRAVASGHSGQHKGKERKNKERPYLILPTLPTLHTPSERSATAGGFQYVHIRVFVLYVLKIQFIAPSETTVS